MLNEKIITIDFNKIDNAIAECEPPVIIMTSLETVMAFGSQKDENPNIEVTENEFDEIVTYKNIPIIPNPFMPFGHIIVK